ncbi:hypothetical protein IQ07DRAFT_340571 [Pyrenochaeta sp. DS3sAY3a]|nr:hypothetical protein IQ07DRAFT_340571 [Pyrenochaeta sp. DS3sAY3a]
MWWVVTDRKDLHLMKGEGETEQKRSETEQKRSETEQKRSETEQKRNRARGNRNSKREGARDTGSMESGAHCRPKSSVCWAPDQRHNVHTARHSPILTCIPREYQQRYQLYTDLTTSLQIIEPTECISSKYADTRDCTAPATYA